MSRIKVFFQIKIINFLSREYISSSFVINGLTNFWDFNNDYYDKIGKAYLYGAVNVAFVYDRKGRPNSAIYLNNGYINAPNGYYFSGVLSITAWVNPPFSNWITLIKFTGDTKYSKFWVEIDPNGISYFGVQISSNFVAIATSSTALKFNCWNHLAFTVDGSYYRVFINGTLTGSTQSGYLPENFLKYSNFIGKNSLSATCILDQLKFFNRALSLTEIKTDMNSF